MHVLYNVLNRSMIGKEGTAGIKEKRAKAFLLIGRSEAADLYSSFDQVQKRAFPGPANDSGRFPQNQVGEERTLHVKAQTQPSRIRFLLEATKNPALLLFWPP